MKKKDEEEGEKREKDAWIGTTACLGPGRLRKEKKKGKRKGSLVKSNTF